MGADHVVVSAAYQPRHPWRRRGLKLLFGAVLIGVLVAEGIAIGPYIGRAIRVVSHPDPFWLSIALAAELVSLAAAASVQRRMLMAGGTRVTRSRMTALTYTANAVSATLPAGAALSSGYTFKRLRDWGASVPLAVFTLIASGILSSIAFAALVVTAVVFAKTDDVEPALLGGSFGLLIVGLLLARGFFQREEALSKLADRVLHRTNRILRREPQSGRARLRGLIADFQQVKPQKRDWAAGLGFASVNWTADLVCLIAACRAVNAHSASIALIAAAYVAGMSTSGISLLPGGLGIVDGAMILVLTRGHVSTVEATASVLLYRLTSYAFNVVLGWLIWTTNWYLARRRVVPQLPPATGLTGSPDGPLDAAPECSFRS